MVPRVNVVVIGLKPASFEASENSPVIVEALSCLDERNAPDTSGSHELTRLVFDIHYARRESMAHSSAAGRKYPILRQLLVNAAIVHVV